jgi:S-adenosylmethionine decarboxylase proenzyme
MSSGKHLICDIKNIKNHKLLNSLEELKNMFDYICKTYDYNILNKAEHVFSPQGITMIYMLSESHMSIHTFPEKNYASMDIYTCREYPNNDVYIEIQEYLKKMFDSSDENFIIIERQYATNKDKYS